MNGGKRSEPAGRPTSPKGLAGALSRGCQGVPGEHRGPRTSTSAAGKYYRAVALGNSEGLIGWCQKTFTIPHDVGPQDGQHVASAQLAPALVENAEGLARVVTVGDGALEFGSERQIQGDETTHLRSLGGSVLAEPMPSSRLGGDERLDMATVRYERRVPVAPDVIWGIVGDAASIHRWFPGVRDCTVVGDVRTLHMANGMDMPEKILTVDPILRRFQYTITSPLYRMHLGTIDVIELGPQDSLIVYSTVSDPDVLALVVGGGTYFALDEIERQALAKAAQE